MRKIKLAIFGYLSWKILQDLNRLGGRVLYRYHDQIHDYTYKKFERLILGPDYSNYPRYKGRGSR